MSPGQPDRAGHGRIGKSCRKLFIRIARGFSTETREHRSVDGSQAGPLSESRVEGRNITESDEQFGMAGNGIIIQERQQPGCPIAAAHAEDPVYRGIGKKSVDIPSPHVVAPGQISPALLHRLAALRPKSQGMKVGHSRLKALFIERRRRGDDSQSVTGLQGPA